MITKLLGAAAIFLPLVSPQAVPNVADDAVIKLERTACGGDCPVYVVTIDAHGDVVYDGIEHVRVKGRQTDRIPVERVAALLDAARRPRFFELADRYRSVKNADGSETIVTDLPTTFVTIREKGQSKRVEDYYGAPAGLRQLEQDIEEATRVKRWTFIDEALIEQLTGEGWRPGRDELADLLQKALERDERGVVKALLDLGADANFAYPSGWTLLMSARSAAAARLLIAAGADANAESDTFLQELRSLANPR